MATTYPNYPATTFEQAVELAIFSSNQLHNIINADSLSTVATEDGDIPSVRKALIDNLYFKTPITWTEGSTNTTFNQLYYFYQDGVVNGYYFAPTASTTNPITLGSTPVDDDNWRLYTAISQRLPAQVYPYTFTATEDTTSITPGYTFDTAIITVNGVVLVPDVDYTITDSSTITLTNSIGVDPDSGLGDVLFAYLGSIEQGSGTDYATYTDLAKSTGAALIGTSSGNTLQSYLDQLSTNKVSLSDLSAVTGAELVGLPYGNVKNAVTYYSPEMFTSDPDSVTDWAPIINLAISQARTDGVQCVQGYGIYMVSSSILVDNFSYGFKLDLGGLHTNSDWPTYTDWKKATPLINVGSQSNGSQVGLSIRLQYAIGNDIATMFQLNGYGCGGSDFFCGRARNFVIGYQCDNSTSSGSASNRVTGDYWYNGKCGIRVKRGNSTYIAEGHKVCVGFITNMIYGAIQLFDGAQYAQIYGTDVDFNGKYLAELAVSSLPSSDIRGTNITWNGTNYEVLDYYATTKSTNFILVMDSRETTGGNSTIKVATSGTITDVNSTTYTITSVRTPTSSQFYFDFIHGFQGAAFGRCDINFGYMAGKVGGLQRTSAIFWHNSFDENSNELNGLWVRNQSSSLSLYDKWSGLPLTSWDTTGAAATMNAPGQVNIAGILVPGSKTYVGSNRLYGTEVQVTLANAVSQTVRTFSFIGNGTVTNTKEVWNVTLAGPVGLSGIGGTFQIHVGSSGIELKNTSGISYPTLSASGYNLVAIQSAQTSMPVTFMFERKL